MCFIRQGAAIAPALEPFGGDAACDCTERPPLTAIAAESPTRLAPASPETVDSAMGASPIDTAVATSPTASALRRKRRASAGVPARVSFDERPRSGCVRTFDTDLPALLVNARYRRRTLSPLLRRPRLLLEVIAAAHHRSVILESATFDYPELTGTVVVRNIAFEKHVTLRLTTNGWKTTTDVTATWRETVAEAGDLDRFAFAVDLAAVFVEGAVLQLCVGYESAGQQYWDNNGLVNYAGTMSVDVLDTDELRTLPELHDSWAEESADADSPEVPEAAVTAEASAASVETAASPVHALGHGVHTVGSSLWLRQIQQALGSAHEAPKPPRSPAVRSISLPSRRAPTQTFWAMPAVITPDFVGDDSSAVLETTSPYTWSLEPPPAMFRPTTQAQ